MGTRSHSVLQASNGISLSSGLHSVTGVQLRDQFSCGNDYAPKVFIFLPSLCSASVP